MRPDVYENNGEGILCVYKNEKWLYKSKKNGRAQISWQ